MKKVLLMSFILLTFQKVILSQNIGINETGDAPVASAMLDISSTNKGLLIPRVALSATNSASPITTPIASLLVYNTATAGSSPYDVAPGYYYWNGSAWISLLNSSATVNGGWALSGNVGTNASTHFIGTTDNVDWTIKTNSVERARFTSTGKFGIGTNAPSTPLHVKTTTPTTGSVTVAKFEGTQNAGNSLNYVSMQLLNNSTSNTKTSIVLGGSTIFRQWFIGNDAFANNAQNFFIFDASTNTVPFFIDGVGNTGIGTFTPNSTLTVAGSQSVAYRSGTGDYTILRTDHVVINTGAAANWTLPAANTCAGRIYRLINHGTGDIILSLSVRTSTNSTSTTLVTSAGSNYYEILSDGTEWRRIN